MPGMMDTILNLGLNDKTVIGLSNKTSNKKFGYFFTIIFFLISIYFFSSNNLNLFYLMLIISLFFFIISYFRDYWLKELNNSWFRLGLFLSKMISPIIISIIFYFLKWDTA